MNCFSIQGGYRNVGSFRSVQLINGLFVDGIFTVCTFLVLYTVTRSSFEKCNTGLNLGGNENLRGNTSTKCEFLISTQF
jgi:hypothetical protein